MSLACLSHVSRMSLACRLLVSLMPCFDLSWVDLEIKYSNKMHAADLEE